MARVPITDLPIRVFTPLDPADKCIALIGNLPIRFTGDTPLSVRKIADTWRREEVERIERAKVATTTRVAAMKAGREAAE